MASKYLITGEKILRTEVQPDKPGRISVKLRDAAGNRWEEMSIEEYQTRVLGNSVPKSSG